MNLNALSLDLAKNVFSMHGVDGHNKTVLRKMRDAGQVTALDRQVAIMSKKMTGLFR